MSTVVKEIQTVENYDPSAKQNGGDIRAVEFRHVRAQWHLRQRFRPPFAFFGDPRAGLGNAEFEDRLANGEGEVRLCRVEPALSIST